MIIVILITCCSNKALAEAVWTEVETGLWDELEDQFVAGVGF